MIKIKTFAYNLIFNGVIPYFSLIKKITLYLAFTPVIFYLFADIHFIEYGEMGWKVLIAIMLIRPISDVFSDLKILKTLCALRKELGIFTALLLIIHSYSFFAIKEKNIFTEILNSKYWHLNNQLTWGILGFIVTIILLITSNNISVRILKKHWKTCQRLTYLLFFFSAIHITLIKGSLKPFIPVLVVLIFWILAELRIDFSLNLNKKK